MLEMRITCQAALVECHQVGTFISIERGGREEAGKERIEEGSKSKVSISILFDCNMIRGGQTVKRATPTIATSLYGRCDGGRMDSIRQVQNCRSWSV